MYILFAVFVIIAFFCYFAPAFIAYRRGHPSFAGITVINLVFGWSLLGWIICLVWAIQPLKETTQTIIIQHIDRAV